MNITHKIIESPIGKLRLSASDKGLTAIDFERDKKGRLRVEGEAAPCDHPVLAETERQLMEYFAGERTSFDLPLDAHGTPFQKNVWKALSAIPFGQTRSYVDVARQVGNPKASRAVGAANGRNPIPIVVPCHRVIGASGKLVGFGGGLGTKEFLLRLEQPQLGTGHAQQ